MFSCINNYMPNNQLKKAELYNFKKGELYSFMTGKASTAIGRRLQKNFKQAGIEITIEQWSVLYHLSIQTGRLCSFEAVSRLPAEKRNSCCWPCCKLRIQGIISRFAASVYRPNWPNQPAITVLEYAKVCISGKNQEHVRLSEKTRRQEAGTAIQTAAS